ncbi:imidazoleglycerol-phosphate dehydratase [Candidatus Methanoplasma termitum]|uniref:Imidazoleglycerol-phosphate dehydratase n=1 Tax=Candidatus Methanoplasma termitum TaxID=1577791 RepID=A0A0A7LAX3_9ARCH|nr:imidazoleglycerol-phosphate dehydratase [Candidatus Methanoplasma termitum]AIZ56138.1 imidazoleglycerol-phosphate dehydratase [Candidatus Methanoplasma termitum]MCL2333473.1 imidazoleglycerol-phosphate dehydratase [Candidatus Methanoplasma sp.]
MTGRAAELERSTRETNVSIKLNIDGAGKFDVKCDVSFLKHMIETFARYGSFDITMKATGDDDHHLIEDVAITLGNVFRKALDDRSIERISTVTIPMDDALVTVSVDIIDRSFADIDCPDQLYHHFLRSFAMSAGITLHVVKIRGFDEHHIIEASFKALGTALRYAVYPRKTELSTKDRPKVK